jgi:hypothetical protein
MPDFSPPFGQNGNRRLPNANEQSLGWPCGPIDQALLNGLFHLHNGNIADVITEAGITGPDGDLTKLRRAIEALIASIVGEVDPSTGIDTSQFVLMTQARNRLPIFPDVQNVDGRIGVTAPSTGTVRLAGGVEFLHRGIFRVTTTQTDFPTDPSKTYHMRWSLAEGFELLDLASGAYNPGTLSEANAAFDSTYDDMLIARVVTNSSNVAAITTLANLTRLDIAADDPAPTITATSVGSNTFDPQGGGSGNSIVYGTSTFALNWSRTPRIIAQGSIGRPAFNNFDGGVLNAIFYREQTRYTARFDVVADTPGLGATGVVVHARLMANA